MKSYELTYIISPEITNEEANAKGKEIESSIQSKEGLILRQENPNAKTLSYPIKKHASGFIGVLEFQIEPEKLSEINEIMKKDDKIVRHMVIIKRPVRERKIRRARKEAAPILEKSEKIEMQRPEQEPSPIKTESKAKVELKDIEQKLDEILGE